MEYIGLSILDKKMKKEFCIRVLINASVAESLVGFRKPFIEKLLKEGFGVYAICDFTQNEHIKSQLIEMGVYPLDINLSKSTFSLIKDSIYFLIY